MVTLSRTIHVSIHFELDGYMDRYMAKWDRYMDRYMIVIVKNSMAPAPGQWAVLSQIFMENRFFFTMTMSVCLELTVFTLALTSVTICSRYFHQNRAEQARQSW